MYRSNLKQTSVLSSQNIFCHDIQSTQIEKKFADHIVRAPFGGTSSKMDNCAENNSSGLTYQRNILQEQELPCYWSFLHLIEYISNLSSIHENSRFLPQDGGFRFHKFWQESSAVLQFITSTFKKKYLKSSYC